ncbi:MAG: hypothetical protein AAF962_05445 [Actinomycetota bacterium]
MSPINETTAGGPAENPAGSAAESAAGSAADRVVEGSPGGEPKYSQGDIRQRNKYFREFLPGMVAYSIILVLVLSRVDEESASAPFLYLLPVLPMVWVAIAVYRSIRRADEYGRLLQYESMALAFGVMIITSLVFGFLGMVVDGIGWAPWVIFALGMTTWGVTLGHRSGGD